MPRSSLFYHDGALWPSNYLPNYVVKPLGPWVSVATDSSIVYPVGCLVRTIGYDCSIDCHGLSMVSPLAIQSNLDNEKESCDGLSLENDHGQSHCTFDNPFRFNTS